MSRVRRSVPSAPRALPPGPGAAAAGSGKAEGGAAGPRPAKRAAPRRTTNEAKPRAKPRAGSRTTNEAKPRVKPRAGSRTTNEAKPRAKPRAVARAQATPPAARSGPEAARGASDAAAIEIPRVLPRGRHKLDPRLVAASQRARLLEAMTELVAEKGYAPVTISDVVTRAGIAKRTFYKHFPDKVQCFLAALDATTRGLIEESNRSFRLTGSIQARCDAAMRGFLGLLAARPNTARVLYLEAVAAGPEAAERWLVLQEMFARNIIRLSREAQAIRPEARVLSETHALAVVGALHGLIYRAIKTHGPERLLELGDELVTLAVAFLMARPAPAVAAPKSTASPTAAPRAAKHGRTTTAR